MRRLTNKILILVGLGILLLGGAFIAGTAVILQRQAENSVATLEAALRSDYDALIKQQVETVISMIEGVYERQQSGELTEAEAKTLAADLVRDLRYGEEGYFWIDTYEGDNVVLLGRDVEGTNRHELEDAQGKRLVADIIEAARREGGGFTDYWFPRAEGGEPLPKRGYSNDFEPWNWVVGTGNYIVDISTRVDAFRGEIRQSVAASTRDGIIVLVAAIVIAGVIAFFVGRRIANPLTQASGALAEIAGGGGDLTARLKVRSNDEVGEVARQFNNFVASLSEIVSGVKSSARDAEAQKEELSATSAETAASADEIAATVRSMRSQVERLSAEAEESSVAAGEIASDSQELSNSVGEQASAVEESSASIEEMVASIKSVANTARSKREGLLELQSTTEKGREEVRATEGKVSELTGSVAKLQEAITVINNIASQTNILSMNAAIEAAHAGDRGKGFAVVAQEIRSLAESSAENAKAIGDSLKKNAQDIESLKAFADSVFAHYTSIEEQIGGVQGAFDEITQAMDELSTGAEQIGKAVVSLRETTGAVETSTTRITERSRLISGHAEKVSAVSAEALDGISEIDAGTSEISSAMQELNRAVAKLSQTIGEISRSAHQFKTESSEAPEAPEEDGVQLVRDAEEGREDSQAQF